MEQITYTATSSDFEAAYQLFLKSCKAGRSIRMMPYFGGIMALSSLFVLLTAPSSNSTPAVVGIGIAGLWIMFGLRFRQKAARKRQWETQLEPGAKSLTILLSYDEDELSFRLERKSEARFYWSTLLGYFEDEKTLIVIPSKNMFYFIVKSSSNNDLLEKIRSRVSKGNSKTC